MKRIIKIQIAVTISIIFLMPILSLASVTIKGKLVGVSSLIEGGITPVDRNDPRVAWEPDFVILTENGEYYLIPNVPREVKSENIYRKVKVIGKVDEKYSSINAEEFHVKKRVIYKLKWTQKDWEREQIRLYDDYTNVR